MAQQEVGSIVFQVKNAGEKHVDLTTAMGVANCKQFHQFGDKEYTDKKTGRKHRRPLCYTATIEWLTGATAGHIATAPTGYCTVNSLVQASAAWNSQIKRTGISKKKLLSRYGQRLRVGLIDDSVADTGLLDGDHTLQPYATTTWKTVEDGMDVMYAAESNEAGDSVSYMDIGEVTTFVVPGDSQDDEPTEEPVVILTGTAADSTTRFRTIREWRQSRQGTAVEPDEGREVTTSSKMFRMFSDAQPEPDEIIVELDEYQEFRPYSDNSQYRYQNWGKLQAQSDGGQRSKVTVQAPCGLIQIGDLGGQTGAASQAPVGSRWLITIHAIYEM